MDAATFDKTFPAMTVSAARKEWETKLNDLCLAATGLHLSDLPDQPFADMYDDGLTPKQAWRQIKENLAEEDGHSW